MKLTGTECKKKRERKRTRGEKKRGKAGWWKMVRAMDRVKGGWLETDAR